MYKWSAEEGMRLIETEKCKRFVGVPTMLQDMLAHPEFRTERLASLKQLIGGGAPVPPSQVGAMRKKAKNVENSQGYGLTETMGIGSINIGLDFVKHPTSAGRAYPLIVNLAIKDPETGKMLPDGQRGEVCLKGPVIMKGYHNKPEATAKSIDKDGWFHSGDVGRMEGGFLYIMDRIKDLIIRGGENIDCSEVEAALYNHPGVRECSVFALPDERLGEVVGAAVCVEGTATTVELSDTAASTLAKFKVPLPEHIFIQHDLLPKGATGKIDKKGLRDHFKGVVAGAPRSKL